jgi:glycosyltransferase involved in cell wall biosynthesis
MAPRITLVLLCYNQRHCIQHAVQSCFAQVGEPIEILLSDDASTDGGFELMQSMAALYRGPHTVRLRRNERNLGIGEHYNRAIADSTGQLLVTAAGDDISLPQRVQALAAAWDASAQTADLVASHAIDMTQDGQDVGLIRVAPIT